MSNEQAQTIGFKSLGKNCLVSDKAVFYGVSNIEIGDDCRIDDFALVSAGSRGVVLGRNVHVACFVSMIGQERIELHDFVGVSAKSCVYSSTDDYSGECLTNPTVPDEYKSVIHGAVIMEKHALVGAGCVILPGVTLGLGCCVGAMSLVNRSCEPYWIYTGIPARKLKPRSQNTATLEAQIRGRSPNEGL